MKTKGSPKKKTDSEQVKHGFQKTEQARTAEELEFKSVLLDSATDSVFVRDFGGSLIYVNEAAHKSLGYTKEELLALPLGKLRAPGFIEDVNSLIERLKETNSAVFETVHRCKDGTTVNVEVHATILEFQHHKVIASIVRDITERKKAEKALRDSEQKYRTLFLYMAQGALYRSTDGWITSVNPAAESIFGMTAEEMMSKPPDDPCWKGIAEDGSEMPGEMYPSMIALKTGKVVKNAVMRIYNATEKQYRWICVNAIPQFRPGEDKPYQVFTTFDDISERKRAEEQLAYLATHDPLTDLPNRRSLEEALTRAVAKARRGSTSALLFLDVDNFKLINDALGHAAGDEALLSLIKMIYRNLRLEDLFARLGGDEFAILLEDVNVKEAKIAAERMRRSIERHVFKIYEYNFNLSLSIGLVPVDGSEAPWVMLAQADTAMYEAKACGGNRIVDYHHRVASMF